MLFQMLPTMYYLQNRFLNPSPGFTIGPPSGGPPPTAGGGPPSMSGGPPSSMSAGPPTATSGGPPDLSSLPEELSLSFQSRLGWFQKQISPYSVLSWTVIFCVKFAFLSFFRQLVRRLRPMQLYWRGVAIFTVIAYLYCVAEPFFSCPKPPSRAGKLVPMVIDCPGLTLPRRSGMWLRFGPDTYVAASGVVDSSRYPHRCTAFVFPHLIPCSLSFFPTLISFDSRQHPHSAPVERSDQDAAETWFGRVPQPEHLHGYRVDHPCGRAKVPWDV